jgi:N-acyl-D-aspartate/D-glutamate deacylase
VVDLIIRDGLIVDGTGTDPYPGDVAVAGGKIVAMGRLEGAEASEVIEAQGQVVCPGFIDVHSHADLMVPHPDREEILKPLVLQGITTFVGGNCGVSNSFLPDDRRSHLIANLESLMGESASIAFDWNTPSDFMSRMKRRGLPLNMGLLIGHGSLRIAVAGLSRRLLTPDEQSQMERHLSECLEMGCLGLSTGLQYFPGLASDSAELVGLGRVLEKFDRVFTSHLRSYAHTLDLALDEVFTVGRENGIRVQISHFYWQPYSRGLARLMRAAIRMGSFAYDRLKIPIPIEKGLEAKLERIDRARRQGVRVHFDMVPTAQGFTSLFAFLPPYLAEGSTAEALARLEDREFRRQMLHDLENVEPDWPHNGRANWSFNYVKMTGWSGLRVMAVTKESNRWMEGLTFPQIGRKLEKHPMDAICDLLLDEQGSVLVFHTPVRPDDPFTFRSMWSGFTHPLSMPVTDTILLPFGRPSHVFYDCFPRFIELFVKQKKKLTLQEAIGKCTSLPAEAMGIRDRGALRKGMPADLVVFDLSRLGTKADFHNPDRNPDGIGHVFVNGRAVVEDGVFKKGVLAGDLVGPE